jgi:hypothetical protein
MQLRVIDEEEVTELMTVTSGFRQRSDGKGMVYMRSNQVLQAGEKDDMVKIARGVYSGEGAEDNTSATIAVVVPNGPTGAEAAVGVLDTYVESLATTHSQTWFGTPTHNYEYKHLQDAAEVAGEMHIRLKLALPGGKAKPTQIRRINEDGTYTEGTIQDITTGSECIAWFNPTNMWFVPAETKNGVSHNAKFGISLLVAAIAVKPPADLDADELLADAGFTEA